MTCVGEPRSGHETDRRGRRSRRRGPAGPDRPVLIVGGGPAGLECARVLAGAGPDGSGWPSEPGPLGGALALAAVGPGRERLRLLTDWLAAECARLGVEVRPGRRPSTPARSTPPGPTGGRWSWPPAPDLSPTGMPAPPRRLPVVDALALLRDGCRRAAGRPGGRRRPGRRPGRGRRGRVAGRPPPTGPSPSSARIRSPARCWPGPATWPTPTSASSAPGWPAGCAARITAASAAARCAGATSGPASRSDCPPRVLVDCGHRLPDDELYLALGDPPCRAGRRLRRPPDASTRRSSKAGGRRWRCWPRRLATATGRATPAGSGAVSGAGPYRHLFTPLRIGPLTVANRIVFSAHLTNYATEDGLPERAARRLLRGPGRRRRRADHHRGALDPPDRLAVREAHPRLPPRGHPRLPPHHRRRPRPRRADPGPDQPQRRAGVEHVLPAAGVGAEPGAGPAVPGGAEGGRSPRDRRDRRRLRPGGRALHGRRVRRRSSCSARTRRSCAASCRRPPTSAPTATAARLANRARLLLEIVAAVRDAIGPAAALGVRLCGDELIEGGTDHRRRGRGGPHGRGHRAGRLHQHLDRGGDRHAVHDRGEHAGPAGVRHVHPECHPRGGGACPVVGVGPVQGPAAGRPGAGRPASATWSGWSAARSPTPTSRPRPGPATAPTSAPACPATRSASAGWGSTGGWAASRTPGPGGRRSSWPRRRRPGARRVVRSSVGGGPGGLQAAVTASRTRPPGRPVRAQPTASAVRCRWRPACPSRAEFLDITRNLVVQAQRLGRRRPHRRRGRRRRQSAADGPTW